MAITACSSAPKIEEFADTANPADEVRNFSLDMAAAKDRQVDVLAPNSYKHAEKALKYALDDQKGGKNAKSTLHSVATGRAYLLQANQSAEVSKTNLEAVVTARQAAIVAGAPKTFADDFADADSHLKSVTENIESNDLSDVASSREKLQKEYLDAELKAIQLTNLGPAKATIAVAMKEGAGEYAKQSLAIANKTVSDTDAFIIANRHQTDAVKSRSEESTKAADHLLKITRAAKAGKNVSPEQAALLLESEQAKTQEERSQLNVAREAAKDLAVETADLKSDAAFNKSFEAARSEFTKSEAEIYRQGNRLVIRLKTLEFPTNQSVLKGSNFPVMGKVAKVIKGFENSSVLIEGHTDSDGGKVQNEKLSKERAQAFSDYLVSSDAIARDKITVAGYGFQRPLTSNKTSKGKAQNRRVDVIITPENI